jgi:hypothetical protein
MKSKISYRHEEPRLENALNIREHRAKFLKATMSEEISKALTMTVSEAIELCESASNNRAEFSFCLTKIFTTKKRVK